MKEYVLLAPFVRILNYGKESILCNLSNGKWIKINKEIALLFKFGKDEFIKKCKSLKISNREIRNFLRILDKYAFSNNFSTGNVLKNLSPFRATYLNITNKCNLSCAHCYYENGVKSHGLGMSDMISVANSLFLSGIKLLTISGGEPLIRPDAKDLFKSIGEIGFKKITLLTNGLLMNREIAHIISNLGWDVRVSLDGHNEEINAKIRGKENFQKTIRGIKILKEADIKDIHLITTVCSVNIKHLVEIELLANKLGVNFGTSIFTSVGNGAKNSYLQPPIDEMINYFTQRVSLLKCEETNSDLLNIECGITCGCGVTMISVDCFGNVFPCHLLHKKDLKIGNLIENRDLIKLTEKSSVAQKFLKRTVEYRKCHGCRVEYFCKGGCLARTRDYYLAKENSWMEKDPLCALHKKILSAQLWKET